MGDGFFFSVLKIFCGGNFFLGPAVPRSHGFCRPDPNPNPKPNPNLKPNPEHAKHFVMSYPNPNLNPKPKPNPNLNPNSNPNPEHAKNL